MAGLRVGEETERGREREGRGSWSGLRASSVEPHEDRAFADLELGVSVQEDGNLERGALRTSQQS